MNGKDEVIQTHPVIGWDISTVDSYDALMIRLHYLSSQDQPPEDARVDRTLWLTTDVARQLITILEAGIAKIEDSDYQQIDYIKH
ncbi:biofilm formation regulator BssS [Edwardsiella tarda]|uniref:Transcriptional regulator n=3 Tax=Edwardsiella tarda TaxID=636 RepID=A0A2A7U2F9_EDWTA|nr:biofilm formation regulator BssS [Edwardsiella tarda]AKH88823.1 biofilm formation regulator BssS [Edwardsiella tarda]ATI65408.1 transcriptional regulator [Edwardsiella tarda]EFE22541.1 biofilm formation regulatory protein BssS [Edwardsiella tarda ATCC 23685]PEH72423.1 transcriptional regulator [Edwardsiella tarda]UAL55526.1 biofilm formation regulator BssS [Edwardsiella tarda]